jgi:hypothetical protein
LTKRLAWARTALTEAKNDAAAYEYERETLRRLALDVRAFAQRHHLTVAKPIWGHVAATAMPDAVFYSGGANVGNLLQHACDHNRLTLLPQVGQGNPSRFRYEQLRGCHLAVFDMTSYNRDRELESAADLAPVAYELGIALALGKAIVVVARKRNSLPFDVDVEPVCLENDGDLAAMSRALDSVLYGLQRGGAGDSVASTAAYVRQLPEVQEDAKARIVLSTLSADMQKDALATWHVLANALSHASMAGHMTVHPSWAASYPDSVSPRCFHVTGFRPWTRQTCEEVRLACERFGVAYVRGDEATSPDMIRAIWDEIGRATHVVVDLSALNLNAVMELGMAHTLGRNVLLIGQEVERIPPTFRAVAKLRTARYSLDDMTHLRRAFDEFLTRQPRSAAVAEIIQE